MEKRNLIWELIAKKSAGEATEMELRVLNGLLEHHGTDIHYMMSVMDSYWEEMNAAGEKKQGLQSPGVLEDHLKKASVSGDKVKKDLFFYWASAAVIALSIAIGWLMWNPFYPSQGKINIVTVRDGSRKRISLPDGSEVWLNGGSKLIYSKGFNHCQSREVTLSGEGYFKIKHDKNCPFIIHTDYLDIRDLGTVFNVKAYPDEKEAIATLISGSIEVSIKDDPGRTIVLKPHEKVSYFADIKNLFLNGSDKKIINKEVGSIRPLSLHKNRLEVSDIQPVVNMRGDTIVAETAWVNNELVFQGEKFSHLAESMQRWYNVSIRIENEQVANYTFTGIFDGETLKQALEELKMIRGFSFEIDKDTVIIK